MRENFLMLVGIVAIIWVGFAIFGGDGGSGSSGASEAENECGDEVTAFVMSQEFVKRGLRAPATAEFPWYSDDQVSVSRLDDCTYDVNAYVDAENAFGANIRTFYSIEVESIPSTNEWRGRDLVMN